MLSEQQKTMRWEDNDVSNSKKRNNWQIRFFLWMSKPKEWQKDLYAGTVYNCKIDEEGERIPLTICDYDREAGTITIVFQVVGASTQRMTGLEVGDSFRDFVGTARMCF